MARLEVLRAAVERQLPVVAPPQMVSTAEPLRDKIVELAEKGVKARAIFDRLRLEDPTLSASYWAVRGVWRRWHKERGVRAEDDALDRFLHHAHVIEMEGDTFRNPPGAKRAKNSGSRST
jgi:hypothetical protein